MTKVNSPMALLYKMIELIYCPGIIDGLGKLDLMHIIIVKL